MHLNYHFLQHLSVALNKVLGDAVFVEAFSQQKDVLIIVFRLADDSPFYIKADLGSSFSCLSFPEDFKRSRKNSVNLFQSLNNTKIDRVYQHINERAFSIFFAKDQILIFKLHGNRSNIILLEGDEASELFKSKLVKDREIKFSMLDRVLERSFSSYQENPDIKAHFPTFGKAVNSRLSEAGFDNLAIKSQWDLLTGLEEEMALGNFFLCEEEKRPTFTLLKTDDCEKLDSDPINAINTFYYRYTKVYFVERRRHEILSALTKKRKQLDNYIQKSTNNLKRLQDGIQPREIGDIIMANLHAIDTGITEVSLLNFYSGNEIKIKLNKNLSPQKNAENYYRKSKNRNIEVDQINRSVALKQNELDSLTQLITEIESAGTVKELDTLAKTSELHQKSANVASNLPYKEFLVNRFKVWVGKNAKSNDQLTLKHTFKEDLWLHAKDVPGSHVVLKHESNRPFDQPTIERVAEIAAYYSKRKTDTLAPVIYTPAKFVRKRKGSPAGSVVVEKEKVVIVPPKAPDDN